MAAARAEWARRHSIQVADAYAWALHAAGHDEAAAQMSERALALGTRNATFLFHAGMIQRSLGNDDAARSFLHEALALNPNFSIRYAGAARRALDAL